VYDGGGPTGNYADNSDAVITISPTGATGVTLNFISFDVEPGDNGTCNYDYLEIFNGTNTSAPSLGRFCNLTGSPGTINSTGGSITILLHSDEGLNLAGFEADWSCSLANTPPIANFVSTPISTCTGDINFTDNSTNGPTSWLWDFGDGNTSNAQNPSHNYSANGIYDVSLTATNSFGSNTFTATGLINVNRPATPVVIGDSICPNEQAILLATGNGIINWFTVPVGETSIFTGNSFTTPNLTNTTTYFAENSVVAASQYVGPTNNTSNGGTNTSQSYLIFDCFSPVKLISVSVNATTAGNRLIELKNSTGTVLQSATINIPSGVSRIALNFNVPIGTDLQLVAPANCGLYRINTASGATIAYPYTITSILSIKPSNAGTGSYYYFFDWEIKEPDCISPRISDTAYVSICERIEENNSINFQLFPNPTSDLLYVNFNTVIDIKSIKIINLIGKQSQLVFSKLKETSFSLDLKSFSEGIYFISIETNKGKFIQKIIKQ